MKIKSLTVFCGSKSGNDPIYIKHAEELGSLLVSKNITLVYGGGNKGIMGTIANSVLDAHGKVIGIMPKILDVKEHVHTELTELIVVKDMHTRKKLLYKKGDAALVLAGGFGTMDEFFEMLTWDQLDIHNKSIFIVNSNGFYQSLIEFLKKVESENFLYHKLSEHIIIISEPSELKDYLQ